MQNPYLYTTHIKEIAKGDLSSLFVSSKDDYENLREKCKTITAKGCFSADEMNNLLKSNILDIDGKLSQLSDILPITEVVINTPNKFDQGKNYPPEIIRKLFYYAIVTELPKYVEKLKRM